jgi:hypothetical protein
MDNEKVEHASNVNAKPPYLMALGNRFDSEKFVFNVCMSYRHDFGMLTEQDKQRLRFECKDWMRAILNNWQCLTNHKRKAVDEKFTVVELLRAMQESFEHAKHLPLGERELAKAELVNSLLKKVDNGSVLEF